ncbi:MAG: hypothetical protein M1305_02895, partial [Candidatus Marsarchaeota archaeon]|nr:hypothetical protein [Candidatus Marsarchaeota archaeon]
CCGYSSFLERNCSMAKGRITLPTWAGRKQFQYEGSVREGTTIYFGSNSRYACTVTASEYAGMLAMFNGQEVSIGTSRTDPPNGSLGKWLTEEYKLYAMTSYIGPILIREGFAERGSKPDLIQIKRLSN